MKIDEIIRNEKNLYQREWRAKNKDRVRVINRRYWENRARKKLIEGNKQKEILGGEKSEE